MQQWKNVPRQYAEFTHVKKTTENCLLLVKFKSNLWGGLYTDFDHLKCGQKYFESLERNIMKKFFVLFTVSLS